MCDVLCVMEKWLMVHGSWQKIKEKIKEKKRKREKERFHRNCVMCDRIV